MTKALLPTACACMGKDYFVEPECPCRMESMGLPRSQKWHDEHTPEYLKQESEIMNKAFSDLFKGKA